MLEEGDKLLPMSLPDQNGEAKTLEDLTGPEGLVLYSYPKDNTPGCTTEAKDFNEALSVLQEAGYEVAGVSKDGAKSHCNFIDKHGLEFTLLTDKGGDYMRSIGAFGEKKMYGKILEGIIRSTFVIGADGTVKKVYRNVRAKGHVGRLLRDLGLES
ncbi:MAG: peroxiredoxin [Acidobacteriota bacterium]